MEWIRISNNKLKIMLTAEDARRYALRCEQADYADVMTRRAFRSILTDVREEADFDATEDKVYIQMYPSKEGGCELFVTRMGVLFSEEGQRERAENPAEKRKSYAFRFSDCREILTVCRLLSERNFSGESEAFFDEESRWWLLLTDGDNPAVFHTVYGFIKEYGKSENAERARLFLGEHAKCLCTSRAVETLKDLS